MLLETNDRLREVWLARLQNRRVVGALGLDAPDGEVPSEYQYASPIAEPSVNQAVVVGLGDEVVGQHAILRGLFFPSRLRFLRVLSISPT